MGFYFRKSIRVGPLRFNLSKSGIGVSAGIPGFRIGTGPRGNYVHMGMGGIYYRATLPTRSHSQSPTSYEESYEQTASHAPLQQIGSGDVAAMTDSSSAALLAELEEKNNRIRKWPFSLAISVLVVMGLIAVNSPPWLIAMAIVVLTAGIFVVYQWDVLSKTVVILYDLDSAMMESYEQIHGCVGHISNCGGKWHINARGEVYDPKYHAGADQLVNRNRISPSMRNPPYVKTNVEIPCIQLANRSLYFFPERILVYSSNGVGAVSYADLGVVSADKRFIEDGSVPRDAEIVDHTWQYVNKSGGPDRRFKDNRQLPICRYEELWLNSTSGLNEVIQVSRLGVGQQVNTAIGNMADILANAASKQLSWPSPFDHTDHQTALRNNDPGNDGRGADARNGSNDYFCPLFDVLCCLMVADGRASSREKKCICDLMSKVSAPWSESQVASLMDEFIERVRNNGYRKILNTVLEEVTIFKRLGKQEILFRCLNALARADEKLDPRELQLCRRIKMIVED